MTGPEKVHSFKKVLVQLVLLAAPTAAFLFYLLWRLNTFYALLENNWLSQGLYFLAGAVLAIVFYAYRFRFITTVAVLFLLYYLLYKLLGSINVSEFDAFYFSIQFMAFCILFCFGWLAGYGFSRSRYFTIVWSVLLLVAQLVLVSKTAEIKADVLITSFIPVLAYAFYIIYTAELIRNMNEDEVHFGWFVVKRLLGFGLVLLILFIALLSLYRGDFKSIEKEWGGAGHQQPGKSDKNGESMTSKDKNGGVRNKDQTKLSGALNKDKELVFVANLDHFLQDGKTPNPLYFTYTYYTKFDTATQTFEIDPKMPYNDLFQPDPSKIPLYFKKTNEQAVKNALATRNRKSVSVHVYNVNMAASEFLAPSTAYFCQPVSVPSEFKTLYKSAYLAKMWVSELNSAYFIYNPAGNKQLTDFQKQRFGLLREVNTIKGPDAGFMNYYTYMPRDADFEKISELAKQITKDAPTPIDKIIAIRDYFLSKDEFKQPLFRYSDNPGIPGLPSANKLTYFLFENRRGYCAYFAGATLFLLRSLGLPSRVAAGYLTVDRSSGKNPGWYWFYRDQAHAWVQVYFDDYGWIDFDTTVPDVNTRQAPQPDGTPPTNALPTYLVADGEVKDIDRASKRMTLLVKKMVYHDTEYSATTSCALLTDVSMASVVTDTGAASLDILKPGLHVTAISHAEALKKIMAGAKDSLAGVLKKLPVPVPIDELKLMSQEPPKKESDKTKPSRPEPVDWIKVLWRILAGIGLLALLLFLSPYLIWLYLHARAKKEKGPGAYYRYYAARYYLNQLGHGVDKNRPLDYGNRVDEHFNSGFRRFGDLYQKLKYSQLSLTAEEASYINGFYGPFIQSIRQQVPWKTRAAKFLNIRRSLDHFSKHN